MEERKPAPAKAKTTKPPQQERKSGRKAETNLPEPAPSEEIKEDLGKKFEGFEIPEFPEPAFEESGFVIQDDHLLESKPSKKPVVKEVSKNPTSFPSRQIKPPGAPKPPRKTTPTPRQMPPAVNREPEQTQQPPRKIGKLVIPQAFAGGPAQSEQSPSPKPSPVLPGKVDKPAAPREQEPSPKRRPPEESPTRKIGGIDTSKWDASPKPPARPLFPRQAKEEPEAVKPVPPSGKQDSNGDTPPVLRMIRKLQERDTVQPSRKPTEKQPIKPVEPVKQVQPPARIQETATDRAPEGTRSVAQLLARFQGRH